MAIENSDPPLCEELPYWDFIDEPKPHVVLTDGALVSGIKIGLRDIECLDAEEINQFTIGLRSALNSISEGTTVQFVLSVDSDYSEMIEKHDMGHAADMHRLVKSMANDRIQNLRTEMQAGSLYRPKLRIYLRTPTMQTKKPGFFNGAFKKSGEFSHEACEAYEDTLEVLSQNVDGLVSAFGSLGLECQELSKNEIVTHVYQFLNPKRSKAEPTPSVVGHSDGGIPEDAAWLASHSPREQLVFGDLVLHFDGFTLDSFAHRVITLKTFPEVTYAGQLSNFLRMPFHYDLIVSIEIPAQAAEMAKLQQKRKMAHSLAVSHDGKASDLESESKLSSAEELIRELLNTGQRIYAAQVSIVLRAEVNPEGYKTLNRQVREVLSRFRALQGAEGLEESVGAWKIVKGSLPAAPISLVRARKMKTNNLADFLPVYGPSEGDKEPVVVFKNRLGGLVAFDSFDPSLPNYNCLVTGSSGGGKSFLNNCIILQELARNLRVFIIEIGASYRKLTEALGGQYLEINLSDQYRLNPFDLPDSVIDSNTEPSPQKIKSLLAIVESMVAEDEKTKLLKLDRVLLEKAIIELYKTKLAQGKIPVLSDLAADLAKFDEPSMKALSKMLYPWTGDRPYGRLLDGPGGLKTDARVCTFDLKGLSQYPDLQGVMILIITDFILNQVEQDRKHRKRIILDEAWELLKSPASASFMEYCARTLRKTGSGITFITQGIEEIVASSVGAAILSNTATKFVMLQRGSSEVVKGALKLNAQELALIHSLVQKKGEFSEGFMIEGDTRKVIRAYPGPFEYWLSTSDAQDNLWWTPKTGQVAKIEKLWFCNQF